MNSRSLVLRGRRLHRRQVRLLPRRAAAARGHRRAAGQGHLGLRPAWHLQVGGLLRRRVRRIRATVLGRTGEFFGALDASYRSSFSSSASASRYLVVDGYSLLNARVGFRWADGWTLSLWSRNLLNKDYFELLRRRLATPVSMSGSPEIRRTVGVTLRMTFDRSERSMQTGRCTVMLRSCMDDHATTHSRSPPSRCSPPSSTARSGTGSRRSPCRSRCCSSPTASSTRRSC